MSFHTNHGQRTTVFIHKVIPTPHKLVLIGENINHSLSPSLHNEWLKNHSISGSYGLLPCTSSNVFERWKEFWACGGIGANITAPFKKKFYDLVTIEDDLTKKVGAINTIYRKSDVLYGYNTDVRAAIDLIQDGRSAVIYGAGGAACAIAVALMEKGYEEIYVVFRTQKIIGLDTVRHVSWGEALPQKVDTVINATPVEIEADVIYSQAVELLYANTETKLLVQAKKQGVNVVTGYEFLVRQAQYSFEKWFLI